MMRHVNHAIYLNYLEDARIAYWNWLFGGNNDIVKLSFIMANVNVNYRHPTSRNEKLRVYTRISGVGRSSFKMDYKVINMETSRLILDGSSTQVLYDYKRGTRIPIPDEMREIIRARELDLDSL
jgi:acyl-CoA thioester hydrolase